MFGTVLMVNTVSVLPQMNLAVLGDQTNYKMNPLKRSNLTLDLESSKNRKNRIGAPHDAPLISTPDCKKLDMTTPEIVELLKGSDGILSLPTPTSIRTLLNTEHVNNSGGGVGGSSLLHDLNERNANGCNVVDKNMDVYNNFDSQFTGTVPTSTTTTSPAAAANAMYDCFSPESVRIKEEPMQTVPSIESTPPVSPINMETQEQIKKDRKKARNREAAAKCRKKKLEKISTLQGKVKQLKEENDELNGTVRRLTNEVMGLKAKVVKHHKNGCLISSLQMMNN